MESKVLILGANGLVGKSLVRAFVNDYEIHAPTRQELDLLDTSSVIEYFNKTKFDVVINCAANTNSRMKPFDAEVLKTNIGIFTNLYAVRDSFGKLINFGSGAEFDRADSIFNAKERNLFLKLPMDHYGMSKNAISRICFDTDNFYTLRLFGVFGPDEAETRLLKVIKNKKEVTLSDKYFDYFYVEDIAPVVRYYINTDKPLYKDLNVVYPTKQLLSYFVKQYCDIHQLFNVKVDIDKEPGLNYTGDSTRLDSLELPLLGIKEGLKRYI